MSFWLAVAIAVPITVGRGQTGWFDWARERMSAWPMAPAPSITNTTI
jgi:hypothetical protein